MPGMSERIRLIQYGLGPIGSAMARHVMERKRLELVGGVDIDPAKVGKDIGEVIGLGRPLDFLVAERLAHVLARTEADLVLHATSSYSDLFKDQIVKILEAGLDIVSTAEELSFPWLAHTEEAAEIDAVARRVGKTVLATGVNPGFLMDSLPLNLTAICQRVDRIEVTRVINATNRRGPFQAKIGSGMNGAGTGMLTLDMIHDAGGRPANFCEMGGMANNEIMQRTMEVVLADDQVKVLIISLIGGLTRMDEMAEGIVQYLRENDQSVPIVIRMCGTRAEVGIPMLREAGVDTYEDLATTVRNAVEEAGEL